MGVGRTSQKDHSSLHWEAVPALKALVGFYELRREIDLVVFAEVHDERGIEAHDFLNVSQSGFASDCLNCTQPAIGIEQVSPSETQASTGILGQSTASMAAASCWSSLQPSPSSTSHQRAMSSQGCSGYWS